MSDKEQLLQKISNGLAAGTVKMPEELEREFYNYEWDLARPTPEPKGVLEALRMLFRRVDLDNCPSSTKHNYKIVEAALQKPAVDLDALKRDITLSYDKILTTALKLENDWEAKYGLTTQAIQPQDCPEYWFAIATIDHLHAQGHLSGKPEQIEGLGDALDLVNFVQKSPDCDAPTLEQYEDARNVIEEAARKYQEMSA